MPGCSALNCSNRSEQGFAMKVFPKDPTRRAEWIKKIGKTNWSFSCHSYLCEVHFEKDQWEEDKVGRCRKLKKTAIPTIFQYSQIEEIRKEILLKKRESQKSTNCNLNKKLKISNTHQLNETKETNSKAREAFTETRVNGKVNSDIAKLNEKLLSTKKTIAVVEEDMQQEKRQSMNNNLKENVRVSNTFLLVNNEKDDSEVRVNEEVNSDAKLNEELLKTKKVIAIVKEETQQEEGTTNINNFFNENFRLSSTFPLLKTGKDNSETTKKRGSKSEHFKLNAELVKAKQTIAGLLNENIQIKFKLQKSHIKNQKYKKKLQKLSGNNYYKEIFNEDQLEYLRSKSMSFKKWSSKTIETAKWLMNTCGTKGYTNLLHLHLPYPSIRTLQRSALNEKEKPRPVVVNLCKTVT